jgi:hypothetical protein
LPRFFVKTFLIFSSAALLLAGCATKPAAASAATAAHDNPPIDRHALVSRHNPVLHSLDPSSPLSVGNGEFCFTADVTGLQTFPDAYNISSAIPLCTMADWGWHSFPNPQGFSMANFAYKNYDSHGREVGYADQLRNNASSDYLRENPHKFNLGQIGFVLTKADGSPAQPSDITDITQTLDLWNGTLISHFQFDGQPVDVETLCDPTHDANLVQMGHSIDFNITVVPIITRDVLAVHVSSPLIKLGRLAIQLRFPYASPSKNGSDWKNPDQHTTSLSQPSSSTALFQRKLDDFTYQAYASWSPAGALRSSAQHEFVLTPSPTSSSFDFDCAFAPHQADSEPPSPFAPIHASTQTHWNSFWSTGGAIDLSLSKDPRWFELERRIVLSEYLTAIQSAGKNPPAETGLTSNSWYGRFHMEMYWWHDAHFALWGRTPLLENSMGFYARALPQAQANAQRQGYNGARWPKMSEPSGADSPSSVGAFLIWEQPHPIYLAELIYRDRPDRDTLDKYSQVVFQTADFMASYAYWDAATSRYVLGPPVQAAQERYDKSTMFNPTYELVYWRWALTVAQQWRERLGLPRDKKWDDVLQHLSLLPVSDGKYLFTENTPDSYTNPKWVTDHPSVVNALGVLPGPTVDPVIMRNTLDWIWQNWNWPDTWGWDYPALAMCAARVGEPGRAVDALLLDTPKNHYMADGHVFQRAPDLPLYLPANGGLLTAVAMMAAGWDGAPAGNAPGFPQDGTWTVRWENLQPLP